MGSILPHERLRSARTERGEDVAALSARSGIRVHHLRAIEDGRFGDLPSGIYGRSAIRAFAAAYGLDGDALLAECEPLLPRLDDPIAALARMRGVTPVAVQTASSPPIAQVARGKTAWRPLAAATLDGGVAGVLLAVACAGAALLARVPIAALGSSAGAVFLLGIVLAAAYYVCLGGLSGMTLGEYVVGTSPLLRDPRPLTLRAITRRALAAATADVRALSGVGGWAARGVTRRGAAHSVPPPAPLPSPPPPRDRAEALTWSMNGRASVPPPPPRRPRVRTLPRSPSTAS